MEKPTETTYNAYQRIYDSFNLALFQGQLPSCLITLRTTGRAWGYFSSGRFKDNSGTLTDEIALNPALIGLAAPLEVLQTIVHEMVHLWQHHFGNPNQSGYHNGEWSRKMESIGLIPSSTGEPGGAKVGPRMADYPAPEGVFLYAARKLLASEFRVYWYEAVVTELAAAAAGHGAVFIQAPSLSPLAEGESAGGQADPPEPLLTTNARPTVVLPKHARGKTKYACPSCAQKVWGRPGMNLICGDCNNPFEEEGEAI